MKESIPCASCRSHQVLTDYQCGICKEALCKKCSIFPVENFSYYKAVPEKLTHPAYCSVCYDQEIAAPTQEYLEMVAKAKEIIVFSKSESKQTRLFSRKEFPYVVDNCLDEDDALQRMCFFAVENNFNCLIDISFAKKKIVVGSHKKFIWSGSAIPVNIDTKRIR
jgi:hypothetical protein